MIVCSCAVISDADIETALIEIMNQDNAPLPTPGVVWRHLSKKMNCCGCAPLAVEKIYEKMDDLERRGLVCPCACQTARSWMAGFSGRVRLDRAQKEQSGSGEPAIADLV